MYAKTSPMYGGESVLDTKRGLLVNTKNMTPVQDAIYRRSFFNTPRPDLSELELWEWQNKLETGNIAHTAPLGEQLLHAMHRQLQTEHTRAFCLYSWATLIERVKVSHTLSSAHQAVLPAMGATQLTVHARAQAHSRARLGRCLQPCQLRRTETLQDQEIR